MLLQVQPGPLSAQRLSSGFPNIPGGTYGEALLTNALPLYYTLNKAGRLFSVSALGVNPVLYNGTSGGTPILALFNPPQSSSDLVLLQSRIVVRTTGTAANASLAYGYYTAAQSNLAIQGVQSFSRSMYTQLPGNSVAVPISNTSFTNSVNGSFVGPFMGIGPVTATAGLNVGVFIDSLAGRIVLPPNTWVSMGMVSGATTAASIDASFIWCEIPN
jgi:hypothetical protein